MSNALLIGKKKSFQTSEADLSSHSPVLITVSKSKHTNLNVEISVQSLNLQHKFTSPNSAYMNGVMRSQPIWERGRIT